MASSGCPLHGISSSSRQVLVYSHGGSRIKRKEREQKHARPPDAVTGNQHAIISIAFYKPKQVTRSSQIQCIGNRLLHWMELLQTHTAKDRAYKWMETLGHLCKQSTISSFTFLLQRIPIPQLFLLISHNSLSDLNLDVISQKLS